MKFKDQNLRHEFENITPVIETAAVGKCGWVCSVHTTSGGAYWKENMQQFNHSMIG